MFKRYCALNASMLNHSRRTFTNHINNNLLMVVALTFSDCIKPGFKSHMLTIYGNQ